MGKKPGKAVLLSEDASRTLKALVMRREGNTFEQIGDALGVTPWEAQQIASIAYARLSAETAEELRAQVETRLDDVIHRLYVDLSFATSQTGRNSIYALILKADAQRATLLGLNLKSTNEEGGS